MKETILSNCERNFILRAAQESKRLSGRKLEDFRTLKVYFGREWGLCCASLGETKVLTQVTCEIQEPKTTRPNEGLLFINVELSPMAAPHFEPNRGSDLGVHINRLLEKCIKDSQAVDLESLCIVAEEKVWALRVDVNVLNHDGSLVDCASISALAALAHFKRPDVTTNGEEILVHDVTERDPIPIVLHHYPVCVSFALLNNSENIFADPSYIEERVSDASLTFGINAYREICCLHLGGLALTKPKLILNCSTRAANRAKVVVEIIKDSLRIDMEARQEKKNIGFVHSFEWNKITAMSESGLKIQLSRFINKTDPPGIEKEEEEEEEDQEEVALNSDDGDEGFKVVNLGENCAELTRSESIKKHHSSDEILPAKKYFKKDTDIELPKYGDSFGEGGPSKWEENFSIPVSTMEYDSSSDHEKSEICEISVEPKQIESIDLIADDSEEDEVVILNSGNSSETKKFPPKKQSVAEIEKTSTQERLQSASKKNKRKRGKKYKT